MQNVSRQTIVYVTTHAIQLDTELPRYLIPCCDNLRIGANSVRELPIFTFAWKNLVSFPSHCDCIAHITRPWSLFSVGNTSKKKLACDVTTTQWSAVCSRPLYQKRAQISTNEAELWANSLTDQMYYSNQLQCVQHVVDPELNMFVSRLVFVEEGKKLRGK